MRKHLIDKSKEITIIINRKRDNNNMKLTEIKIEEIIKNVRKY